MSNARILIVEDDLIVAQSIQFHLTNRGYDVPDMLTGGQEAVDRVKATPCCHWGDDGQR